MKEGLTPMFDAGHGGMINGVYQTRGKRSPDWEYGVLYEGAFNRWMVSRLIELCDTNNIPYYVTTTGGADLGLTARCNLANEVYKTNKDLYFLSIHANAGGGEGFEIFTSPNQTDSDKIASRFFYGIKTDFPERKMRADYGDGDPDKEAKFTVLTQTNCPATLLELGFMDNRYDYRLLCDPLWRDKTANSLFKTIRGLYLGE